ncbi:hypothetical protein M9Y10_015608 [Tritrichomonas musculus]|uniref:Uncharacterized protein n=1 Tax=Tritrichomonas musculus TaxID=1915356 RepID=A0ABR2L2P6_9EUKA
MGGKKHGQYKKKYENHMLGCDSKKNEEKMNSTKDDRIRMEAQLQVHIGYLDQHGIKKYQNFVGLLRCYYIKRCRIQGFIELFIKHINTIKSNTSIPPFAHRELCKTNSGEKNIILNRCAYQYPMEFNDFFKYFVNVYYQYSPKTKELLFKSFKSKIDELLKVNEYMVPKETNCNKTQTVVSNNDNSTELNDNNIFNDDKENTFLNISDDCYNDNDNDNDNDFYDFFYN